MTTAHENAPAGAGTPAGAENNTLTNQIRSSSLTTIDPKAACRHCTVPIDDGDVCGFCTTYQPPACTGDVWCGCACHACTVTFEHCAEQPVIAPALLAEADTLLPTLLASRLASASACFPAPEGGTVYVQSSGNRISIAVTEKDPDTQQLVTREFTAELREVTQ